MTYKLVYLARRAATVAREDWPRTWKSHAIFASQFPVLEAEISWMRYCNRLDTALPGISSAHDGVAVAASPSLAGLNGAGFSQADRARIDEDELRVFDMLTPHFTYYCREDTVIDGPLGEVAVYAFLARKPELSHAEFEDRFTGSHAAAAKAAIAATGSATRHVHNVPVHDPLPLFPFDGIAETWFPSREEAEAALQGEAYATLRGDLAQSCDLDASTIMLTGVCHRWPKN